MNESIYAAIKQKQKLTHLHLLGAIEQLIGRSPSDAELAKGIRCDVKKDGSENFFWNDRPILTISPTQHFCDGKVVGWEFKTAFKAGEGEE